MNSSSLTGLLLVIILIACNDETQTDEPQIDERHVSEGYPVEIEGMVDYYVDKLYWIGGECDPSGFVVTDITWYHGEPDSYFSRVYLGGIIDSTYLGETVEIYGAMDAIHAGGVETPPRQFPFVIAQKTKPK